MHRSFDSSKYTVDRVLAAKDKSVTVLLPAREVADTIGGVLDVLVPLQRRGLIDELVVIDSDSSDGTADVARKKGADVYQRAEILTRFGPSLGKGDGIWRGLWKTSGDIVVLMDTDTQNFGEHFLLGLLGPLLEDPSLQFVKGAFRRPLLMGGIEVPGEGGRVTELVARPLINLYLPQLAGFIQPLAGEVAARRSLLESLPVPVGYGVEIAMLIDAWRKAGLDALGQVDLGTRVDRPQTLEALSAMAYAVTATIMDRVAGSEYLTKAKGRLVIPKRDGLLTKDVPLEERPPVDSLEEENAAGM